MVYESFYVGFLQSGLGSSAVELFDKTVPLTSLRLPWWDECPLCAHASIILLYRIQGQGCLETWCACKDSSGVINVKRSETKHSLWHGALKHTTNWPPQIWASVILLALKNHLGSHHMVCPCTSQSACIVCPGNILLVCLQSHFQILCACQSPVSLTERSFFRLAELVFLHYLCCFAAREYLVKFAGFLVTFFPLASCDLFQLLQVTRLNVACASNLSSSSVCCR